MKARNRHPEPQLLLQKVKKKTSHHTRTSANPALPKNQEALKDYSPVSDSHNKMTLSRKKIRDWKAPIFNTGLAGSVIRYDLPFEPVWPNVNGVKA